MQRVLFVAFRGIDTLSDWVGRVLSMLLLPMVGVLVYGVILRYVFNKPSLWSQEVSMYMYGVAGIMAGAYTLRHNLHINMDLFYRRLPPKKKAITDSLTALFFFLFCGVLLWASCKFSLWSFNIRQHSESVWGPPIYPMIMTIPVAAFLILLQGAAKFIRDLYFAIYGKRLYEH